MYNNSRKERVAGSNPASDQRAANSRIGLRQPPS